MQESKNECLDSYDTLNEALLKSIDYVVEAVFDIDPKKGGLEKQIKTASKKLAYNLGNPKGY